MFKRLLKRLFIALFQEEVQEQIEAIKIDYQGRFEILRVEVAHDLLHDSSFVYDTAQAIIDEEEITEDLEDRLRETLEMLEGRIDDIESQLEELV